MLIISHRSTKVKTWVNQKEKLLCVLGFNTGLQRAEEKTMKCFAFCNNPHCLRGEMGLQREEGQGWLMGMLQACVQ